MNLDIQSSWERDGGPVLTTAGPRLRQGPRSPKQKRRGLTWPSFRPLPDSIRLVAQKVPMCHRLGVGGQRMSPNVIAPSREELEARRNQLLRRAGQSLEQLRQRRDLFNLTGEEWETLTELEEIEFLLAA